ncbi:hypothetical protein YC2023_095904 [Brassica napus]
MDEGTILSASDPLKMTPLSTESIQDVSNMESDFHITKQIPQKKLCLPQRNLISEISSKSLHNLLLSKEMIHRNNESSLISTHLRSPNVREGEVQYKKDKRPKTRAKLYKAFLGRQPKEAKPSKRNPTTSTTCSNARRSMDTRQTESQLASPGGREEIRRDLRRWRRQVDEESSRRAIFPNIQAAHRINASRINQSSTIHPTNFDLPAFKKKQSPLKIRIGSIGDVGRETVEQVSNGINDNRKDPVKSRRRHRRERGAETEAEQLRREDREPPETKAGYTRRIDRDIPKSTESAWLDGTTPFDRRRTTDTS